MIPPGEQPGEPGRLGGGKGRVNRLLFGLAKGFGGLKVWCSVKVLEICARVRDKVAKGFAPTSTMRDSHTIGFVPVCRVIANWCCVKAFTCLQVRVLGGFNPQKKRRKPRKRQIAITGFGPQKKRKGLVQCQSLYMPRGQSPRRIQSTKETQKRSEAASSNNTRVCEATINSMAQPSCSRSGACTRASRKHRLCFSRVHVPYLECLALLAPRNVPHLQTQWRLSARCCGFPTILT